MLPWPRQQFPEAYKRHICNASVRQLDMQGCGRRVGQLGKSNGVPHGHWFLMLKADLFEVFLMQLVEQGL